MNKRTGEKIREARIQKGITQKELANQCGMYDSQIRKYESGKVRPKIETLQKIAKALDVPIIELKSDLEISLDEIHVEIEKTMKNLEREMAFLNFLYSIGYEYHDDFHDNDDMYDRCFHLLSDNTDIPLSKEDYENLYRSIAEYTVNEINNLKNN